MLHIWYAIAFQFDSHLGDFPFLFSTFFKTFQSFRLGVRFRVSVWVSVTVSVRVDVRVIFRVGVRLGLELGLGLEFIFCLLRFCQALCRWHLGGKIDTAINLS